MKKSSKAIWLSVSVKTHTQNTHVARATEHQDDTSDVGNIVILALFPTNHSNHEDTARSKCVGHSHKGHTVSHQASVILWFSKISSEKNRGRPKKIKMESNEKTNHQRNEWEIGLTVSAGSKKKTVLHKGSLLFCIPFDPADTTLKNTQGQIHLHQSIKHTLQRVFLTVSPLSSEPSNSGGSWELKSLSQTDSGSQGQN